MRFKDKVAIVTGGGRDIGKSISLRLAAEGAKVVINYRSDEAAAQATLDAIEAAGGTALLARADVTKADEVVALVKAATDAFGGKVDILVNCAGGMVARKTLAEMDEAFFDTVMDLNLKSAFLVTKAVLPHLESGAAIVNIASQAGRDGGGPGASIYAASKGALMTLTRSWAKELGPQGIRVNALNPGLIGTSFHDIFSKPEGRAAVAGNTPLRREGHPDEVAAAVAFLASGDASFLTGTNVDINGGLFFS
ncbi:SDR family NAD(P)-dependent oxidoreductase [Sphingomonas koreensis]|jgi:3-oxoacyl-[acyl-carrier protein] reductase|uniref:Oxidoreductase n=1 Tax=Sphingomonas koreensis TaxID=93064 RepID=A0A1L6J631_9SPHN|nr:glucose 1-dehydrogenase [Sphingomonas koreensis]APR51411.1 oxidoreductase [Sphingomonas koreensis]MDC7810983.1 glucose 1-dehydrogenase [Sphingomonas koreensis]RSU22700.1 SDR family NAD(P)-dependent oxidoreductase [Sphingomonas koreensis]RSU27730.1 SDR family NAD(P)-dependent oxidoreductase [Sphingomonas koreensis]RSU29240.1 SDR family NAD(P)-dependent oxidoreductase [Sphingomonas koreensis]